MPEVHDIFEKLGTKDFEATIKMLEYARRVLPAYMPNNTTVHAKLNNHARRLKEILVTTIAENHPELPSSIPQEKFSACRKFLSYFIHNDLKGKIYTLNYDLLLYWALMHDEANSFDSIKLNKNDGFGRGEPEHDYITWLNEDYNRNQCIYYLHGALHLFDTGTELEKYTWINTGKRLVDQAREALENNKFPLFVAEGKQKQKLQKIKHLPYLHHSYKSFLKSVKENRRQSEHEKSLFIFGHSLDDNDNHIIQKIERGSLSNLFVSVYGDPNCKQNQRIIQKAISLVNLRDERSPLSVDFYDAGSAEVWG